MKKCPQCGTENNLDLENCQSCNSPLVSAAPQPNGPAIPQVGRPRLTDQSRQSAENPFGSGPQQTQPMQAGPQPLTGSQPLTGYQSGTVQSPSPYSPPVAPRTPPLPYGRPELPSSAREKSNIGSWIGFSLLVIAAVISFFAYKDYVRKQNTPLEVVRRVSRAADVGDYDTVRSFLTQDTKIDPDAHFSLISRMMSKEHSGFGRIISGEGKKYSLQLLAENASFAQVVIKPTEETVDETMKEPTSGFPTGNPAIHEQSLSIVRETILSGIVIVCRKEGDKWKVDGPRTDDAFYGMMRQMMDRISYTATGRRVDPNLLQRLGIPPAPQATAPAAR